MNRERDFFLEKRSPSPLRSSLCFFCLVISALSLYLSTVYFVFAEDSPARLLEQTYIYDTQNRLKTIGNSSSDDLPPTCGLLNTVPGQERNPRRAGTECEEQVTQELEAKGEKVLGHEITLVTTGGSTRVDMVIRNTEGNLEVVEVKCGLKARLTPQQQAAFPLIRQSGAELRGKKAVGAQLPEKIGPTPVRIIRVVACP